MFIWRFDNSYSFVSVDKLSPKFQFVMDGNHVQHVNYRMCHFITKVYKHFHPLTLKAPITTAADGRGPVSIRPVSRPL